MKNNKAFASILCVSLLGASILGVYLSNKAYKVTAEECTHSSVVHYDGVSPTSGTGHVEHWACCECHKAWADEAKTVLLGDTTSDRSKIDISGIYLTANYQPIGSEDIQWTLPMNPSYDSDLNKVVYSFNNIDATESFWVETQNARYLETGEVVKVSFYNGTNQDLNLRLRARKWGAAAAPVNIGRGTWSEITVSKDYWNHDDTAGFAFDMWGRHDAEYKGFIKVTTPVYEEAQPEPYVCFDVESYTMSYGNASWYSANKIVDPEKGNAFEIPDYNGADIIATNGGSLKIDSVLYSGVEFYFYNGTNKDFTMYSTASWEYNTEYGTLTKGEWTRCFISAAEWNKGATTYFYPQKAGEGRLLFTYFTTVVAEEYK